MVKDKEDQVSKLSTKQIVSWFIASGHASGGFNAERVNNSIALLRRVPAARYAVLQRFTQLFEEATRNCMDQRNMDYSGSMYGLSHELNTSIQIVARTLNELLEKNGRAWAPILCEWSIESLGQISSCFKKGTSIASSSGHSNNQLNEHMKFWTQSFPTRMLMNLYRYCLKTLIDQGTETCMDSLLITSAHHAPNFDWVVADIGNSFPSEIINRVLRTGFKDFVAQQWGQQQMDEDQSKMKSVVRILEHLSSRHSDRVQKAMIGLYQTPSTNDGTGQIKAILYIMQLLSDSPLLIRVSTKPFIDVLDDANLNTLHTQFCKLPNYETKLNAVSSLAVHLICQSSVESFRLIQFLLKASDSNSNSRQSKPLDKALRDIFCQLMTSLLQDLLKIAMRKRVVGEKENGVVAELKTNYSKLCDEILKTKLAERRNWILTLLKIISIRGCCCSVFCRLLCEISAQCDIAVFLNLYSFISGVIPGLLEQILEFSFSMISDGRLTRKQIKNMMTNLWRLLSRNVDIPGSYDLQHKLHKSLWNHIKHLRTLISNSNPCNESASISVDILAILLTAPVALALDISHYSMCMSLGSYFFRLLHYGRVNNDASMISCRKALVHLSQSPDTFTIVCQFILENSVTQANAILFGRRTEEVKDEDGAPKTNHLCSEQRVSLLSQHRSQVASSSVVGFTPVVVEAGLIGSGPKKKKSCPLSKSAQVTNNECISLLLHRCCCKTGSSGSAEGGVIHDTPAMFDEDKLVVLGSKLLEAVTSCYPGSLLHADTAWPDSTFRKYTVERDLHIFTFLDEHPFAWNILNLLANSPKALWRCSLLLRSISGALLNHWESSRDERATTSEYHLRHSIKVIEVLEKGQLLPEPLCFIGELFGMLSPYEVFLLMSDVWKFINQHPLPQNPVYNSTRKRQFQSEGAPIQPYLVTIHSILHANITRMGHMYSRFVPAKPQQV
ncbi:integrator complex subunit 5-like [Styela clava]